MVGFFGRYSLRVDEKGRIVIPALFRDTIRAEHAGRIYVTCALRDECLQAYPEQAWSKLLEKVATLPRTSESVKFFMRRVIGSAHEAEIDKQGRALVPPSLRDYAKIGINGEIVLLGQTDMIEIWNKEKFEVIDRQDEAKAREYELELAGMGV
ncbi:MAG: division/cell wall cluster transcriptional repressor MraZ [Nitrospirae bacterium]|nr:division/cell wall cluster transcriptional repressor MraZ [Nitrospirota bacterium]